MEEKDRCWRRGRKIRLKAYGGCSLVDWMVGKNNRWLL